MERILDASREALLKETRATLGDLRDVLASTSTVESDREALADTIRQLDELFLLVVAGEFNAGKSAFVNALIGHDILKEGATPTTAQIHLLQYGEEVTTTPSRSGMLVATAPVELLRNINIVDTPGTNAIQRQHEAITTDFIPRSDLVLFLTSAQQPFTESERAFLTTIKGWGKKIVIVINKFDLVADDDREQVLNFVTESAKALVGDIAAIFPVSAKQAQQAKAGEPRLWNPSGFEPLESYIEETLDDTGRFALKLLNPLGVGQRLATVQLEDCAAAMAGLSEDQQLLADIQQQTTFYNEDMQRNFSARLSEIDNIIYEMEKRGNDFFDEMIRLGRVFDLMRTDRFKEDFEAAVVQDTAKQIENRVSELIDWMVEQDLRQWTAVADHLSRRRQANDDRIVGQQGPREGTLAYDRQRLIDSIGRASAHAIESYDEQAESVRLANAAREAVAGMALAGLSSVGVGAIIVAATSTAMWDVTGVLAGLTGIALGLFILPARRRKAKTELADKLADLRQRLIGSLTDQFHREMRRGAQRIEDTAAPFARFVRAETEAIEKQQGTLERLQEAMAGLRAQVDLLS